MSYRVERTVKKLDDGDGVGISQIMESTGLSETDVDIILRKLHEDGTVRYTAAEQQSGEKVAYDNCLEEEPDEPDKK